jgi:ABC-type antimicrobial peptide transport system permease subunit
MLKPNAMFKNHLKIAWRNITRNKLYTGINVLGLSLGICACIVLWLVSSYEFSFDRFHPDKDRIYRVGSKEKTSDSYDNDVPPPAPEAFRKEITGLEVVSTLFDYYGNPEITVPNRNQPVGKFDTRIEGRDGMSSVVIADPNWFSIFKYDWLAGNPTASLREPYKVVLSESAAHKYFGDLPLDKIIGREIVYYDSLRVNVSGIVRDWKKNTDFPYTDFISFNTVNSSFLKETRHMNDWRLLQGMGLWYWPTSFVKLSKTASPANIDAQLKKLVASHITNDSIISFRMQLQPLADIHFNGDYSDNIRKAHLPTLYAMMGIAVFILLLAAVNFINLATAQSIQRAKEIGVRKVLGSGRASLIVQFLTETGVLVLFAVGVALLLINPVLSVFHDYIPNGVRFKPFDPSILLFLLSITTITTLLAGLYPARVLAGTLPVLTLRGGGTQKGSGKWWLRKSLIVFQFCISLIFIIATLVMGNQIRFMLNTDYGFKTDAIVTVDCGWRGSTGNIKTMEEKVKQLPGIEKTVRQGDVPIGWGASSITVIYKGKNVTEQLVTVDWGNEDFIPFYQMQMVAGRNLRHSDSLVEWVINETLARRLGFSRPEEAVGKFLYLDKNKPIPIVGVVADFHSRSFRDPIKPIIIGNEPRGEDFLGIKLASRGRGVSNTKATLAAIEKIFKTVFPNEPFRYAFMDESIANLYETEQKTASLMQISMSVTIFISCMGLFGLSLFTATKRTKEIGIRKVLGASVTNIVSMLSKDFVVLVVLSLFIASPIAWWMMHHWLQDFAYRVPVSWWIFPVAGLGAIVIALLTVGFQAFRAALANPVESLHAE